MRSDMEQDASGKEKITYYDVLKCFKTQYPELKVGDYRPADNLPYGLIIWTTDGRVLLVQLQVSFGIVFILACKDTENKEEAK